MTIRMTIDEILQAYRENGLSTDETLELLAVLKAARQTAPSHPERADTMRSADARTSARSRHPLSEGQKGLWALQKMFPQSAAYNVPLCLRLPKSLDIVRYAEACRAAVEAHPLLSSIIEEEDGVPFQRPNAVSVPAPPVEDLSALPADQVLPYLARIVKQPFSLAADPLVRFYLFARPDAYIALVVVHHLVFDGGSVHPFFATLFEAYHASVTGRTPAVPIPRADYADFVEWERQLLTSEAADEHRRYWLQQLAGPLPILQLPADRPRGTHGASREGATQSRAIASDLARRILDLCRERGLAPSALFLALYKFLLHRHTGETDLIVGVPTLGRPQQRFDDVVGYFVNMIPVRTRIAADTVFVDFAKAVQAALHDGLDHAVYPFPRIVRDLAQRRDAEAPPVFQVAYEYQNFERIPAAPLGERGFVVELSDALHQEGEYELVLEIFEQESGFALHLKYDAQLFERESIKRMLDHYVALIEQTTAAPDLPLAEHSRLPEEETQRLLHTWNDTAAEYSTACVHDLFRAQARRTPDRVAASFGERSLTYRDLDAKSDIVARYLQRRGVKPDQLVGLCMERSLDMLVGLLGVLKSGAAYVPLDPNYPIERLQHMREDSGAVILLTQSHLLPRLQPLFGNGADAVALDRDWETIAAASGEYLEGTARPEHLAYVIYTSGSTGKPKGVMVQHRGLSNFLASMAKTPGLTATDTLLAVTTLSFDIAGLELYLPLVVGARCVIAGAERVRDVEKLKQDIRRVRPTVMQATPSTWTMLFQSGWRNEERVRLLCGGEALPERLKQHFIETGSEAWNLFGPTETTIWSTVCRVTADQPITIGKPIANTQIYILDHERALVPTGAPGELCIAGDGVARGYLHRPELTAQKFLDNPFTPGSKLYATGDRARWRADGTIEFLGRMDAQVKVRGYRIELGEIETRLQLHPDIAAAAVAAEEHEGHKRLVAYCVPRRNSDAREPLDARALRLHLQTVLPDYMVPSRFVALAALPLTPNGKVDRNALASASRDTPPTPRTLPRADIERRLSAIWAQVLGTEEFGVHDRFFDVGGDSITAVTLADRIQSAFNCDFTVTDLFRHSSVREIAERIARAAAASAPVPADPVAPPRKLAAVHAERRIDSPHDERPSVAIIGMSCQFPGAPDVERFWQNLRDGREAVELLSADELRQHGVPQHLIANPKFVPARIALEGKELFDPQFFNISPRDAERMDPQLRLLLLHSWKAVEDAGYVSSALPNTAVFMSASNNFYLAEWLVARGAFDKRPPDSEQYAAWLFAQSGTIPTFISHKLGLKGPSAFVHANCSSSLVALHAAYRSITGGETKYALVGAATLQPGDRIGYLHEDGMNFSSSGHSRAFDADADGMMAGEGIAVVLLKDTRAAIEDGDPIYAILRGIAVNNDGADKAGFHAPSVRGQRDVIEQALAAAGVEPQTIGYVEAHGTGTRLGDPVEFAALREAYGNAATRSCGVGSVKTNVGHLDTAAGLAGCIKVVLSLAHGEIPPSLNYRRPNPNADFSNSPFYVVDALTPWERSSLPRRGAVSSFGIGGTNTHAIFEEAPHTDPADAPAFGGPFLIPVSARNAERLREYIASLRDFLRTHPSVDPAALAYTLQAGRQVMERRVIFIVDDVGDLTARLEQFLDGIEDIERCYRSASGARDGSGAAIDEDDARVLLENWLASGQLAKVAKAWAGGVRIDWNLLYGETPPRRIRLPTYPFAKERHWLTVPKHPRTAAAPQLHPLLHANTSTFSEQRFTSTFTGEEFFLRDHVIQGKRVLPGVTYLEMARAAILRASGIDDRAAGQNGRYAVTLKDVVWPRPLVVSDRPAELHIRLAPNDAGEIAFEVYGAADAGNAAAADEIVHCQGRGIVHAAGDAPQLDVAALRQACAAVEFSSDQLYSQLPEGFDFGPSFRAMQGGHIGADAAGRPQALERLRLPDVIAETRAEYVLHPSLLDAAVGGIPHASAAEARARRPTLPFVLQELTVYAPCEPELYAFVRHSSDGPSSDAVQKYDIDLCNDGGRVCVRIKGYSRRALDGAVDHGAVARFLVPAWRAEPPVDTAGSDIDHRLVVGPLPSEHHRVLDDALPGHCVPLPAYAGDVAARFTESAAGLLRAVKDILADKPARPVLLQVVLPMHGGEDELLVGLAGLLKSAAVENSKLTVQLLLLSPAETPAQWLQKVLANRSSPSGVIRYVNDERQIAGWEEIKPNDADAPWKPGGVYLITGGAGGLGLVFAGEIARRAKNPILYLTGRAASIDAKREALQAIEALGASVHYRSVDVCDGSALAGLVNEIVACHGDLHGVIHAAGIIRDNYLSKKTDAELTEVLAPKVAGLVRLDEATRETKLDFFLMFSSISGAFGNAGQSDYAAANAFLDAYARYRNVLVQQGRRHGRTLAIGWPLWAQGGMRVDDAVLEQMRGRGLVPLPTDVGVQALYRALATGAEQVHVTYGTARLAKPSAARTAPQAERSPPSAAPTRSDPNPGDDRMIEARVRTALAQTISKVIKVAPESIDAAAELSSYGVDSIGFTQLSNELNRTFDLQLTPIVFFEHPTLAGLTAHLLTEHRAKFLDQLSPAETARSAASVVDTAPAPVETKRATKPIRFARAPSLESTPAAREVAAPEPIAVIGLSGRYPMARDLAEFWENLKSGKDCVVEVPKERWDVERYFDPEKGKRGKTYSRWGAFLDGIDRFDPLFFNVSPNDAPWMDPRERLFLQTVWHALEDAGYTRESLRQTPGAKVGVYVGATPSNAAIANRISHFLGLRGPSVVVDTICSSSLVAIHMACKDLRLGECRMAIAGGVNLSLTGEKYVSQSQLQLLGSRSNSRSFADGDGFLPAEAVGAVLLKPLARAEADGDRILAVIRATTMNHNGGGNSYAVPNPAAQAELIEENLRAAGIDARSISYIEAAASGAALGDSIELAALNKAFRAFTPDQQFCAVGTVKSTLGHAEAASGISQLTKTVLQLQYRQIIPVLEPSPPNPHLSFDGTPFYLQRTLADWKRPTAIVDGETIELPRRAIINSFGGGGTYVSAIVEEYAARKPASEPDVPGPQVFVLSAKTAERLTAVVRQLLEHIERHETINLPHLAYTLQTAREAMEARLAIVADNRGALIDHLRACLVQGIDMPPDPPVYAGDVRNGADIRRLISGALETTVAQTFVAERDYDRMARYWVNGGKISWEQLHAGRNAVRIPLPSYPFAERRCDIVDATDAAAPTSADVAISALAPVVAASAHSFLRHALAQLLRHPLGAADIDRSFFDLGLSSANVVSLAHMVETVVGAKVPPSVFFEHGTLATLAAYLNERYPAAFAPRSVGETLAVPAPLPPVVEPDVSVPIEAVEASAVPHTPPLHYPLSECQKGLWVLQKMAPAMSAYNCPVCFRVAHTVDIAHLRKACEYLVRQYPILSTVIEERDGIPSQTLKLERPPVITEEDISALPDSEVRPVLERKAKEPFNLQHESLLRIHILHRGERETLVLICVHHLIFDGTSALPLIQTLLRYYDDLARGMTPRPIAPAAADYAKFVAQEQALVQGPEGERRLQYWKEELAGNLPTLDLLTDRPRSSPPSFRGATYRFSMPPTLAQRIGQFARAQSLYRSTVFLGAFQTLLRHYTGGDDLIVGMPVDLRAEQQRSAIGYFVNMLPLRARFAGKLPFLALLKSLQLKLIDAIAHSYPFPALVRELKIPANPDRPPIFQVAFAYQNFMIPTAADGASLALEFVPEISQEGEYEMLLEIYEQQDGFALGLKYNPDLFFPATIARMAQHYLMLLERALEDPHVPVESYSLLADSERRTLLVDWNDTRAEYPVKCIHRLFEDQAAKAPDAVAVIFERTRLSYRELDERANQLAYRLRDCGVVNGSLVGVCMERSIEMIVALLGILKAGGAYVPIDPEHPKKRIEFVLEDIAAPVLLIQRKFESIVSGFAGRAICLDDEQDQVRGELRELGDSAGDPSALAYVIYTSGSTGNPKGCMLSHAAVCNRLLWMQAEYRLDAHDRVLQKTPYSFDVSVWEFFWPLLAGATLVFARPGGHKDPGYLARLIEEERITTCHFVPSMFVAFMNDLAPGRCESLVRIFTSGESLPYYLFDLATRKLRAAVHNLYGPTEAAVDVTYWAGERRPDEKIPIGRPIANIQIYILRPDLEPAPVGVGGELHIGGVGLAQGYLKRPELTAEKFIANPFDGGRSRLYKTGDLARWLADGNIEYLGRLDQQVKIRGFRIELGEIEAALSQHPQLAESAVVARVDSSGDKYLAAYIVARAAAEPSSADLREFLKSALPEYMVPSVFVRLERLPLTASGKLDRKALPDPKSVRAATQATIAPRTETETIVAELWADILEMEQVGVRDDFFASGGHSLKAVTLISRLATRFPGKELTQVEFYKEPTVEAVAKLIERQQKGPHDVLALLRQSTQNTELSLICSPYAGASAAVFHPLADAIARLTDHVSIHAIALPGNEIGSPPNTFETIQNLAEFCVARILERVEGPIGMYGHCVGSYLALEITRQLELAGRDVKFLAIGAALPFPRIIRYLPFDDPWRLHSDETIYKLIRHWGGPKDEIGEDLLRFMIRNFRKDAKMAFQYAKRRGKWKIQAPIFNILSPDDPLTRNFKKHHRRWRTFADVVHLALVDGGEHYFVGKRADAVAAILCDFYGQQQRLRLRN